METSHIDRKKLDVIESTKVKVNESDERLLQKQSIHAEGKMHVDVIPVVLQHQLRVRAARKELNSIQSEFNSVLANPCYDDNID